MTSPAISVTGPGDILARWPVVGRAIIEGGYQSLLASPLRWRGGTVGALNAFAFQQALDMSAAYDLLVRTAIRNRTSLTATAEGIVAKAQRRPRRV